MREIKGNEGRGSADVRRGRVDEVRGMRGNEGRGSRGSNERKSR